MNTLFAVEPLFPPGFSYAPAFILPGEEEALLAAIEAVALHPFRFQGYEAKRRVASFGWDWSFDAQALAKGREIPDEFRWVVDRVAGHLALPAAAFSELLLTEYPVGSLINWHRDAPPFDIIAGISLGADCTFKLRPDDKEKQTRKATISLPVERRSLYVIRDEARTEWQHSTAAVEQVRYSITLRTLR